jgi:hypothetical protein
MGVIRKMKNIEIIELIEDIKGLRLQIELLKSTTLKKDDEKIINSALEEFLITIFKHLNADLKY